LSDTLIVYGTRYRATPEACAVIQKILEEEFRHHVEIWDLKDWRACPDLSDFDNIVIASGIEYGKWTENALKYLKSDFGDKKVAVFISSYYAGEEDMYEYAYENFLVKVLEEYPNLKPIKIAAFGGRIPKKELPNYANEKVLSRMHDQQLDNRDWDKIESWARKIGEEFAK